MNNHIIRKTAVFYTCGTCNLNCHYCGIDKNPILSDIDKALEESFKGDFYFNQLLKYFPDRESLENIETWGGEPFLKMERIHPLLCRVINYYTSFYNMFSSTNFSYPEWPNKFFGLMSQFKEHPEREFSYILQLSVDGPENINDFNRGVGVTKRCWENFKILIDRLGKGELPKNVNLTMHLKPTLDLTSIKQLDSKEKIVEYYNFLEKWTEKVYELNLDNVSMSLAVPNTAVPSPVTVEDGRAFALFCKNCYEIELQPEKYFKHYKKIMPYTNEGSSQGVATYMWGSTVCGTGSSMVGFLPGGLLSTCHEGFTSLYEEYKIAAFKSKRKDEGTINFDSFVNEQGSKYCLNENQYDEHEKYMELLRGPRPTARLGNISGLIMTLALAGQVSRKYLLEENAAEAAFFLQERTSWCIKDNYNTTGSFILVPTGLIKLLLNGAKEYIEKSERIMSEW